MIPGINPNAELFRWGPIDGRPVYPDAWYYPMHAFGKRFVKWPTFFMDIFKEKMLFVCEYQPLRNIGEENFRRFILVDAAFKKNYAEWKRVLKKLLAIGKNITPEKLHALEGKKLAALFENFRNTYTDLWTIGLLPELSNWGGEQMLKRELHNVLKNESEFLHAFERLSAPEDYSFYQEEEIDLLKIKKIKNAKKYEQTLKKHQQKWFWMLNSYHHTQILSVAHFKKHLEELSANAATEKLQKILNLPKNVTQEKKELIKKYKLSKEAEKIIHRLAFCIWWQDTRKRYIFMVNHWIDLFLHEAARRCSVDFNELHWYHIREVAALFSTGKRIASAEMQQRMQHYLGIYDHETNDSRFEKGEVAANLVKEYVTKKVDMQAKELRGIVVSKGKGRVVGTVKVITSASEISKMKPGDILVAPMTAPDYVVGMKKAAAIVTDEGGMTSHAAIVSRELGVPCIVGTGIATKILKDGDKVEVDTDKGVVRKI